MTNRGEGPGKAGSNFEKGFDRLMKGEKGDPGFDITKLPEFLKAHPRRHTETALRLIREGMSIWVFSAWNDFKNADHNKVVAGLVARGEPNVAISHLDKLENLTKDTARLLLAAEKIRPLKSDGEKPAAYYASFIAESLRSFVKSDREKVAKLLKKEGV